MRDLQENPSLGSEAGCPACRSPQLVRDERVGELVCADCGWVLDGDALVSDRGRPAGDDATGKAARGYGPVISNLVPDRGLSSEIAPGGRDSQGRPLTRDASLRFYRLKRLDRRFHSPQTHHRNLVVAVSELHRLAGLLTLSREVEESAMALYRRALERRATRGKKIVALMAACVYAACRQCRVPRTLKEVIASSRASKVEVGRAYTVLARELRLGLRPVDPRDFLVRYTQELRLSKGVRQKVLELLAQLDRTPSLNGALPNGVLATVIYIACQLEGEPRSQERVAAVANVTAVTIRNHYRSFLELLGVCLPAVGPLATLPRRGLPVGAAARAAGALRAEP